MAAASSSKLTRPQAGMPSTGYLHELDDGDDEENDEVILVGEVANMKSPEETPLEFESSARHISGGQPSPVHTKLGSNGIVKFFPVVSGNDDMQSYPKKQKVTGVPSDWEEDTELEIIHEDQTQRVTEVDIVNLPLSRSKPCVRNISKYFSSVQNCDIFDIVSGSWKDRMPAHQQNCEYYCILQYEVEWACAVASWTLRSSRQILERALVQSG